MAIFSAIAGLVGGLVTAVSGFIGGLGVIGATLLKTAVGLGINLLAQKVAGQRDDGPKFSVQGKLQTGGVVPRSFIFGIGATAGSLVYANTHGNAGGSPNAYLNMVIALSDLPVKGLLQVWVNGQLVTLGDTMKISQEGHPIGYPVEEYHQDDDDYLWINFYDGTQTEADGYLVEKYGSDATRPYKSDRVGFGVAYAVVTARINEELFTGFPQLKFVIDGVKLYDITKDTTNGGSGDQRWELPSTWGGDGDYLPIVQLYNLLRGIKFDGQWFYGFQNMTGPRLPSVNWINSINKCRALIQGPSGLEPTYRSGGEIPVNAQIATAVEALLTACQGRLSEIGGFYKSFAGEPDTPVMEFTDEDILDTEEQPFTPFYGIADTITGINGSYPSPEEGWEAKSAPPLYRTDLEVKAGNRRLLADVSFDLVPFKGQVQRLMRSGLLDGQRARRHTVVLGPRFWQIEPGDTIRWTSEQNGYVQKWFRVDGVLDRANLDVVLDITEVDPSDYDWDQGSDYKPPIDGPTGPIRPPSQPVIGAQVLPSEILDDTGKSRRPAIRVIVPGDLDDVRYVRVVVRLATSKEVVWERDIPYGAITPEGQTKFWDLAGESILPNTLYEVSLKYVPYSSRLTDFSSWFTVLTPDIKFGADDVDYGDIQDAIVELNDWVGWNTRETIERARKNILLDIEQDAANYRDKQQIRQELASVYEDAKASWTLDIVTATGPNSALALRLEELEVTVEEDIATAVDLLQTEISVVDGRVTANADAIQQLTTEVDGVASSVTMRAQAQSSPGGGWARWGVQVKTGSGDNWSTGAFFIDVNGSISRVVVIADQFVITNGSATIAPFVFQGNTAYLENARIGDLRFDRLRSNNGKLDINGSGSNAYIDIFN